MDLFEQPEHIPVDILNVTDGDFVPFVIIITRSKPSSFFTLPETVV